VAKIIFTVKDAKNEMPIPQSSIDAGKIAYPTMQDNEIPQRIPALFQNQFSIKASAEFIAEAVGKFAGGENENVTVGKSVILPHIFVEIGKKVEGGKYHPFYNGFPYFVEISLNRNALSAAWKAAGYPAEWLS
jgi:hypothetical protein